MKTTKLPIATLTKIFLTQLSLLLSLTCAQAKATGLLRTVAFTGDHAPGTATGVNFSNFQESSPVINDSGLVAFRGVLSGSGVSSSNDSGIWSEGGGAGLSLVARSGNQAPSTDVNFARFSIPNLNDIGQTAFTGFLVGTGVSSTNDNGIWSERGSGLSLVVRKGSQAPGAANGDEFASFRSLPLLNNSGETAFHGILSSGNTGVWSEGGGVGLELVSFAGGLSLHSLVFNDAGHTAFRGSLGSNRGIFSEVGGAGLSVVAQQGDLAPGISPGFSFDRFGELGLNNAGHTAFMGVLAGSGNRKGVWSEGGGAGLKLVALEGAPAPGVGGGAWFANFDTADIPAINSAGLTAFKGSLAGPGVSTANNDGIWSEGRGAGLALVARQGSQAPGVEDGTHFGFFYPPVLNAVGQTAFRGLVIGPGVNGGNNIGIWAQDQDGILQLIARKGGLIDVNNDPLVDDYRTISSLSFASGLGNSEGSGNEDGRGSSFNDLGQLVFSATFTDGTSGVFVSNLVAVPEPTTLLLCALSTMGLLICRASKANF